MVSMPHRPDGRPSEPGQAAPVVATPAGPVRGVMLGDAQAAYLGIPYAEAPIGDLRFALAVKRAGWSDVRDASRYGATPLRDYMTSLTAIPEPAFAGDETLVLNVFTPRPGEATAALPVFVWIHGGGFVTGSASSPWYEGGAFPRDGVVVVSVSYRLGFDGFGVIEGAPDNRAVRDWILALEWVRDSIAEFGGDPDHVTVGGQSAGGTAALTLLTMPSAQHLFVGAIAESPCMITGSRDQAVGRAGRLAQHLGIGRTRAGFAGVEEEVIFRAQAKMGKREIDLPYVRGVARGTTSAMGWSPVVDGDLIPYRIEEGVARGIGAQKRLLIGATANEMDRMGELLPAFVDQFPTRWALFVVGFGRTRGRAYAAATPGGVRTTLARVMSDAGFRFYLARILTSRGGAARTVGPSFVYDFRLSSSSTGLAGHCIELPFVWDCLDGENVVERNTGPNPPQPVADLAHAAWVSFIAAGSPGWPAYTAVDCRGMIFDRDPQVGSVFVREQDLAAHQVEPR